MRLRSAVPALAIALALARSAHAVVGVEPSPFNPVANPAAVVVSGNARFTVLTDRLLRIEYSSSGTFEDRASIAVVNRNTPVPPFSSSTANGVLSIKTSALSLSYSVGSPFTASTLSIATSTPPASVWHYGNVDSGNLFGTIRSLDMVDTIDLNCTEIAWITVYNESLHCEFGLVSQLGWAVFVDNRSALLDANDWPSNDPSADDVDLYFFGHGFDFRAALADYVLVGGPVPMLPRYAHGVMWSRWYDISTYDVKQIVDAYESRAIPLDIFIMDMDWHMAGWTGYTFDSDIFPFSKDALAWFKTKGLRNGANLHDADGVQSFEMYYRAMALANGVDPASGDAVAMNITNPTYANSLEDIVLQPVEKQGMDFWWIDWQQGGDRGVFIRNVNPTIWLNHIRSTDHLRRGEDVRGWVLGRFGGLGNHRYQAGFSGDVIHTWQSLAFQPSFSLAATNVAYGYWSHDIVGSGTDYELFVRWVQWGSVSALYRTHDAGSAVGICADLFGCAVVEIWNQPNQFFEIARAAVVQRHTLLPYLYTLNRVAFETGLGPLRPMYYDYAAFPPAFSLAVRNTQYMLGDSLLVSPITTQRDANTSMCAWSVWVPPSTVWYDLTSGQVFNGSTLPVPSNHSRLFDLSEIPIFAKAGAVLPEIPYDEHDVIGVAQRAYTNLTFTIVPGAPAGSAAVYEDDGLSYGYARGEFAWTTLNYTRSGSTTTIVIRTTGNATVVPATRGYTIRLLSSAPPTNVVAASKNLTYSRWADQDDSWTYDGHALATVIQVAPVSTQSTLTIVVGCPETSWHATAQGAIASPLNGLRGGFERAYLSKANLDPAITSPTMKSLFANLQRASSTPDALEYLAGTNTTAFFTLVSNYTAVFQAATAEANAFTLTTPTRIGYSRALLHSAYQL